MQHISKTRVFESVADEELRMNVNYHSWETLRCTMVIVGLKAVASKAHGSALHRYVRKSNALPELNAVCISITPKAFIGLQPDVSPCISGRFA